MLLRGPVFPGGSVMNPHRPMLGAAMLGSTALVQRRLESAATGAGPTVVEQLEQLGKLRASGVLTEEEFALAKARVLA